MQRNDGEQIRSDIHNVHEVVQEMVVDLEVRVLYVDEDIIALEIVEVAIEIVEVLMMQNMQRSEHSEQL